MFVTDCKDFLTTEGLREFLYSFPLCTSVSSVVKKMFVVLIALLYCCIETAAQDSNVSKSLRSRERAGGEKVPDTFPPYVYESIPDINSSASDFVPVPNRWRQFYAGRFFDPYNQNILKGDIPIFGSPGHEWFFVTGIISDSQYERFKIPLPVGGATTKRPGSNDTFGDGRINVFNENVFTSFSLIRGYTTFMPPEFEFRISPVFNYNHLVSGENGVLRADPGFGDKRDDSHIGFQELFIDYHLVNISERYDFISSRIGVQQFQSDFRGFVYNSNDPGVRLFGNYDNNKWQYNAAWFSRLEKDTNSGLNTIFDMRHEDVVIANLYRQDAPVHGHTLSLSMVHREDQAGDYASRYDENEILRRPASIGDERAKNISNTYLGLSGDGHFGRVNTTSAYYYALGSESHNPIAQQQVDIRAQMAALEASYDMDWIRFRGSFFWASGDRDPFDRKASGFDAIFDNPNFAGGDLSYWQRQGIPLIGGGGVFLTNRGSLLPDMRAGKEEGQSNFVNPGVILYNAGIDFDLTPKLKLITNASYLQFDELAPLRAVRQDGSFGHDIGFDLATGILYRPFLNNNVLIRVGVSTLLPGDGLKGLYKDQALYDVFTNLIFEY